MSSCYSSSYGIHGFPACSGHGTCVDGQCVCFDGWTSRADLELVDGVDCDIDTNVVKSFATVDLALSMAATLCIAYCMIVDTIGAPRRRSAMKAFVMVTFLASNMCSSGFSALRIVDPVHNVVGGELLISILASLTVFFGTLGFSGMFTILVNFLKGYARMLSSSVRHHIQHDLDLIVRYTFIAPVVLVMMYGGMFVGCCLVPTHYSDYFNIGYLGSAIVGYLYYSLTVLYILRLFIKELNEFITKQQSSQSFKDSDSRRPQRQQVPSTQSSGEIPTATLQDDIKKVVKKFEFAFTTIIGLLGMSGPLNILFLCWNFLRRKNIYLILLQGALISISTTFSVWSLVTVTKNKPASGISGSSLKSSKVRSSGKVVPVHVAIVPMSVPVYKAAEELDRDGDDENNVIAFEYPAVP